MLGPHTSGAPAERRGLPIGLRDAGWRSAAALGALHDQIPAPDHAGRRCIGRCGTADFPRTTVAERRLKWHAAAGAIQMGTMVHLQ